MQLHHSFSPLDSIVPPLYNAIIFGFPRSRPTHEEVFSVLENSLHRLIRERPFLAADMLRDNASGTRPGALKLHIPDPFENIKIVLKDLRAGDSGWRHSYKELKAAGMPLRYLDGRILAPLASGVGTTTKVISVQVNYMNDGYLLSLSSGHALMDACSLAAIMNLWAQYARVLQEEGQITTYDNIVVCDGRAEALYRPTSPEQFETLKVRPELWHVMCLDESKNLNPQPATASAEVSTAIPAAGSIPENLRTALFAIDASAVRILKDRISPTKPAWISGQDAIHALIWRCIMKARFPPNVSRVASYPNTTMLSITINGRSLLFPPISTSYIGNVLFFCLIDTHISKITLPETELTEVALLIRHRLEECKDKQLLSDAVDLAASIPDVQNLQIFMQDYLGAHLSTSSLVNLPFYKLDFGAIFGNGGRPEFFRLPKGQFGGICLLLPQKEDGTIEVTIGMKSEDMDRLLNDEEFSQYASFMSE
ncbi:hypothetical protein MMC25_007849 [Agyrium rufum]|nr:hypothetical protein [Agyrium rufum]